MLSRSWAGLSAKSAFLKPASLAAGMGSMPANGACRGKVGAGDDPKVVQSKAPGSMR